MSGPLEGIKVIDCGRWYQAPGAAAILGDMGADVIKVEEPVRGDPVRGWADVVSAGTGIVGYNVVLEPANRNKRAITLDLRSERGREVIYKLVEKADVFVHCFLPGVSEKLGVDYETLSRYNPQLIYGEGTGYGSKGPDSKVGGLDRTALARAGWMYLPGESDMPPLAYITGIGDWVGVTTLALGIISALCCRERQGIGQKVEASLFGSLIAMATLPLHFPLVLGQEFPRRVRAKMGNPLWSHFRCGDDKWIALAMGQADRYWPAFCKVLGIEELEKDPRFENMDVRSKHPEELIPILDKVFASKSRAEWLTDFNEAKLIAAPIQTLTEVTTDPQALENEYIVDFDHPTLGPTKIVGVPYKFSKTPASIRTAAPELGQHTEEVLLEIGYTWDDITRIREEGAI